MAACEELVQAALPDWSTKEIRALLRNVSRGAERHIADNPGASFNDAVEQARLALVERVEETVQGIRANTAKNALKVLEGVARVRAASDKVEGLRSLLIGTQRGEAFARASAAGEQRALALRYEGGLIADIAKTEGGLKLFSSGVLDDDIARAMWQLDRVAPALDELDPSAIQIARAINKWQEISRLEANDAGANIGKLDGYITRQSHDPPRISADRASWEDMARLSFDWERMEIDDIPQFLNTLWADLSDGIHLKVGASGGRALPKGIGRYLSHERIIHFKDADSWLEYNRQFGAGNLRESVIHGLERNARATGLMRVLGPDHEMNYQRVVELTLSDMKRSGEAGTREFLSAANRYRSWYLAELDGSTLIPGNDTLATFGSNIRALQNVSALGSSVFASVGDLSTVALNARFHDASLFDALGTSLSGLFKGLDSADRLELLSDLGVAFDSISGSMIAGNRFSIDANARGTIGRGQHQFFQMNLQNSWTDRLRAAAAEFLSMNLARKAGLAFDKLRHLRTTLGLYGIDAGRWDIIRKGALRDYEGRQFLTPSALDDAPDSLFSAYLGENATPSAIRQLRRDVQRQLRGYFTDQNGYMVLTPDTAVLGALRMGTQRGTVEGEALRLIFQFRTFNYAFTQRIIGRELQQNGWHGIARTLVATAIFGYISMTLRDIAHNRVPRRLNDIRTLLASIQQGGGAGLYSDLIFSQVIDRRFADAGLQLFGPTAADVLGSQGIAGILARSAQGRDPSAAAIRFAQSNAPFINLFYTKPLLDYLIFWHMQEAVNPGSLQRMERELEQRRGQQLIVSPSETIN